MTITCETCKETVHVPMGYPEAVGLMAFRHLARGDHMVFVGILRCACGGELRAGASEAASPKELREKVEAFMAEHAEHEGD